MIRFLLTKSGKFSLKEHCSKEDVETQTCVDLNLSTYLTTVKTTDLFSWKLLSTRNVKTRLKEP